jgi:hypothetical protein
VVGLPVFARPDAHVILQQKQKPQKRGRTRERNVKVD